MHYTLPITAGTYQASRKDSINTGVFKVTGADFGAHDLLILMSYKVTGNGNAALFVDFGFDGTYYYFNTGAKRRIDLGTAISNGQPEGICFIDALHGYTSNEYLDLPWPLGSVTQSIRSFNIYNYIKNYYKRNQKLISTPQAGTFRYNEDTNRYEGYDGNHWNPFNY